MTDSPIIEDQISAEVLQPDHYDYDGVEPEKPKIFVGGRKSKLAVVQSRYIANSLRNVHPGLNFPVIAISTLGDRVHNRPLYAFGGKALWTKELETLLLEKLEGHEQVDMVVHSLKDMPTTLPDKCILGAISKREDPRDAVVMKSGSPYKHLSELPQGSTVGTSSIRRSAQLRRKFPGLLFESVRGNVQTRIDKLNAQDSCYSCIILAAAGLKRLDMESIITSYLDYPDMYYAVGQGALGVEIREGDHHIHELIERINHKPTALCCGSERSLMKTLEGGCSVPIGVHSRYDEKTSMLTLRGIVVSVDGTTAAEDSIERLVKDAAEAEKVGSDLAALLISKGAKEILDAIHLNHVN